MLKTIAVNLIEVYQVYLRSILPASCRFSPSCSEYARQAIIKYGLLRGAARAVKRLLHCHSFSDKAGYDPLV